MSAFNVTFPKSGDMDATMSESGNEFNVGFSVNGKVYSNVTVNTTEYWNSQPNRIGAKNVVYVYSDYRIDEHGNAIPAFKVGDGLAYLIDLPFSSDIVDTHMADAYIHISNAEREFWNNKVTALLDADNEERIIFTKN